MGEVTDDIGLAVRRENDACYAAVIGSSRNRIVLRPRA